MWSREARIPTALWVVGLVSSVLWFGSGLGIDADQAVEGARGAQASAGETTVQEMAGAAEGNYQWNEMYHEGEPLSLFQLVSFSRLIVVGRSEFNQSTVTPDQRSIVTEYRVVVSETLKGVIDVGGTVEVVVPGGRVSVQDGHWAQLNVVGFRPPRDWQLQVWFLRPARRSWVDPVAGAWGPAFGPLGLYHEDENGRVMPAGRSGSRFAKRLRSEKVTLEQLKSAVREAVGSGT